MTLRRLYVMFSSLPPRNLVSNKIGKVSQEEAMWELGDFILANLYDAVENLTYLTLRMNSKPGASIPKPKPHPRPGRVVRQRQGMNFPGKTLYTNK